MSSLRTVYRTIGLVFIVGAISVVLASAALAQNEALWAEAVNLSQSGAASQPLIAAAPDGVLHAVWWDATDGLQYARTATVTGTAWTTPVTAANIFGVRQVDAATNRVTLIAPEAVRLLSSSNGEAFALWRDADDQLLGATVQGDNFSGSTPLAEIAVAFDVTADVSNTLHLGYVRTASSEAAPAGVYYRRHANATWGGANPVYTSPYFRPLQADRAHVSAAGLNDIALVAWDDPQLGQSAYARSTDGGETWSEPQVITGTGRTLRARVTSTPDGEFLLIWQDAGAGGCGFVQRTSNDGGETWSAPQRVLGALTRCTADWSFMPDGDGRLWLIERLSAAATGNSVSAAVWQAGSWSAPFELALSFFDPGAGRQIDLSCVNAAVAGQTLGLIGCDPNSDVLAARNTAPLDRFISARQAAWAEVEVLSDRQTPAVVDDLPALAADSSGALYALWSQQIDQASVLLGSAYTDDHWSAAVALLRSAETAEGRTVARQPALAIDSGGRAHAVWNGGTTGAIYYSWTYARDFTLASGWAEPIALPMDTPISSWPDLAIDPRGGDLFVVYAVPYNEGRGLYLARSADGGSTWPAAPQRIVDAAAQGWESVTTPRLAYDAAAGVLHVVWVRDALPGSASPRAVYYAQSRDRGRTWSEPVKVAEGQVGWPRVAMFGPDQVCVAWTQQSSQARVNPRSPLSVWSWLSADGGQTWTTPATVPGFEQISGAFGLIGDESGRLDLAAMAQLSNGESVLLHASWQEQRWSEREVTALGQNATAGNAAALAVSPSAGRLAALLRAWLWDQSGSGQFEVVATWREIPKQVVTPLPTFTPVPTVAPGPTATPEPTATPRPQIAPGGPQPIGETRGPSPLIIGGVLAAIIVIAGVAGTFWMKRR